LPPPTQLTSLADVKEALNIEGPGDDARINLLLDQVTDEVQSFVGRSLFSASYSQFFDGGESKELVLRERPVSSIANAWSSPGSARVYDSTTLVPSASYTFDPDAGIIYRIDGAKWGCGPRAVRIDYVGGWLTVVPPRVSRAAIEVIAVKLYKGTTGPLAR
jgi:hypothetical protein